MEKVEAKLQKYRNELNSKLGSVNILMGQEKKYHESQMSTLRKKVSKYQLRKMQLILEEKNCKFVNITFATPMVGNMVWQNLRTGGQESHILRFSFTFV